jgi:hypothetical protein
VIDLVEWNRAPTNAVPKHSGTWRNLALMCANACMKRHNS